MTVIIRHGDCREVLRTLPDDSVNCCVTSPPYFWLRDYGVEGQIGHEATVVDFVNVLADVFDEVKRVLRPDGVLWLNLGDSYYSGNGQPKGSDPKSASRNFSRIKLRPLDVSGWDIPKKSLCGVPWLVALELQRRQWTLRSDVIWCRETALAEPSVTDRPGRQHEYLFLFSKSRRYHFDKSALREESVWHIPHQRGLGGHSAAFPVALAEQCILSGCPAGGTVLDPFGGAGITGLEAERLGRDSILIELNPEYAALAERRIRGDAVMFASTLSSHNHSSGRNLAATITKGQPTMTREQKEWMDRNKTYRALGQRPGAGARYVRTGILHTDGTFEPYEAGKRPAIKVGSFEVGILQVDATPTPTFGSGR